MDSSFRLRDLSGVEIENLTRSLNWPNHATVHYESQSKKGYMTKVKTVAIITALLWATAIVASAILKVPSFLSLILLPLLAFVSVTTVLTVGRRHAN